MNKVTDRFYFLFFILIFVFSVSVRIYWASKQDRLYHDEYASIFFSNNKIDDWHFVDTYPYNKVLNYDKEYTGKEIKIKYFYDDNSIEDCLKDIVSLYKNSNDPFISNLYYSFLRFSFIGRVVYEVDNIILTGTILNSLFFMISFIFMYKLMKLLFSNNKSLIIFGMICTSLLLSSISFATFLRPYQMQETFFIVFTYMVSNTLLNKNFSFKNFILLSLFAGLGYLTLSSSIVFVLCISLSIFLYYLIISNKNSVNFKDYFKCSNLYIHFVRMFLLIFALFFAIIILLGMKTRSGYLEIEKTETVPGNLQKITLKIKYNSKVFRDSDIYKLYDVKIENEYNTEEILKFDVSHIARINIVTVGEFNNDNIKNIEVSFKLKPKSNKIFPIIILILLLPLFIIFIKSLIIFTKNNIHKFISIKQNGIKYLFYFALSFMLAFLLGQGLYLGFFRSIFKSGGRTLNSVKANLDFLDYLNRYGFSDYLIPIIIMFLIFYIFLPKGKTLYQIKLPFEENIISILIIFTALLWAFISNILAPYRLERYSISSYPLIMIILPLGAFVFIGNKKIMYIFMIVVSCFYIKGAITSEKLAYLDIDSSNEEVYIFKKKTQLMVYGLGNFLSIFDVSSLESSQKYVLLRDEDNLLKKIDADGVNNFYIINMNTSSTLNKELESKDYMLSDISSVSKYANYTISEYIRTK